MTFPFPTFSVASAPDAFTSLLLHFDGANGSTAFPDSSVNGHTVSVSGSGVTVSTATPKFGSGAANFTQAGQLSIPNHSSLQMGTGDFTVDFWARVAGNRHHNPLSKGFTSAGGLLIQFDPGGAIWVYLGGSNAIVGSSVLTTGVWQHHALVRSGTSLKLYLNGVQHGSATNSTNLNDSGPLIIGGRDGAADNYFNGQIDEYRISKGIARWTSDFTPPSAPY